jgi:hypothetical protein
MTSWEKGVSDFTGLFLLCSPAFIAATVMLILYLCGVVH